VADWLKFLKAFKCLLFGVEVVAILPASAIAIKPVMGSKMISIGANAFLYFRRIRWPGMDLQEIADLLDNLCESSHWILL